MTEYTAREFIRKVHEWYEEVKPYSPDPAFTVFDIINNPQNAEDKEFVKKVVWFNQSINEKINKKSKPPIIGSDYSRLTGEDCKSIQKELNWYNNQLNKSINDLKNREIIDEKYNFKRN